MSYIMQRADDAMKFKFNVTQYCVQLGDLPNAPRKSVRTNRFHPISMLF